MNIGEERTESVSTSPDDRADHALLDDPMPPDDTGTEHTELLPSREPFRTVMKAIGLIEQSIGLALVVVILVLVLLVKPTGIFSGKSL